MTYFPQPNPAKRSESGKAGPLGVFAIRSEGGQPVRAKLHALSVTGGLLVLSKALDQGSLVEVVFQTSQGTVHAMAELLVPKCESTSGCLQPFR